MLSDSPHSKFISSVDLHIDSNGMVHYSHIVGLILDLEVIILGQIHSCLEIFSDQVSDHKRSFEQHIDK